MSPIRSISSDVSRDPAARCICSLHEQRDSLVIGQRRYNPNSLAVNAQRLAAGDNKLHARRAANERIGELSTRGDDVFTIVQHQQHPPGLDMGAHLVDHRLARVGTHTERGRHRIRYCGGSDYRCEVDDDCTVGVPGLDLVRQLHGESGLPDSAGTRECQESRTVGEPRELGKLALPSDEWGWVERK